MEESGCYMIRVDPRTARTRWFERFEIYNVKDGNTGVGCSSELLAWIHENINKQWTYPRVGEFWFEDEYDALAFKLRWT